MDYIRNYFQGFRIPNLSKLWYGQDVVDGSDQVPLVVKLEYYLVKYQELALWTDPKSSAVALALIHLAIGYLASTSNTAINLTLWLVLLSFVYTTWVTRIWPEIRVEDYNPDTDSWRPSDPEVFSAPEMVEILNLVKGKVHECYLSSKTLRQNEPGKFCLLFSGVFLMLSYIGTFMSTLGLLYYTVVGSFVIPGLLKVMGHHPQVQSFIRNNLKTKSEVDQSQSYTIPSIWPTLQSGVAALQASIPEMSQLQKVKNDLSNTHQDTNVKDDDLKPYMPSTDDVACQQILEDCASHGGHDPTQVESFHQDEPSATEYKSLMEGLNIPGHDEIDHQSLALMLTESPSIHQDQSGKLAQLQSTEGVEDEFLPSKSDTLLLSQTIDEMETNEDKEVLTKQALEIEEEEEEEDFELISAEELKKC